jgi:hypothetical protein
VGGVEKIVKSLWWCLSFRKISEPVGKTLVPELQERCSIYGITPDYEFVQMEGPDHAPTYWYSVTRD